MVLVAVSVCEVGTELMEPNVGYTPGPSQTTPRVAVRISSHFLQQRTSGFSAARSPN